MRFVKSINRLIVFHVRKRFSYSLGNLTLKAYEDDCEFADPAGSFKGLKRFKRNCSNFGSLLEKSNMKLTKWEDFEVKNNFLFYFFSDEKLLFVILFAKINLLTNNKLRAG